MYLGYHLLVTKQKGLDTSGRLKLNWAFRSSAWLHRSGGYDPKFIIGFLAIQSRARYLGRHLNPWLLRIS
jgi:hypothetical protein